MEKIEIPRFAERLTALTLPKNGKMYASDNDEVYEVDLKSLGVKVTRQQPYAFMKGNFTLGISDNSPIKECNGRVVSYDFDPELDNVSVRLVIDGSPIAIDFPVESGDWFFASFSECGNFLVMAEPYILAVYRLG